jgi:putative Mg2+ transporter-C (MgtC) family protein
MTISHLPEDIFRLLLSIALGAIIGIERELRGKAAGVRTITMISLGSCLFTLISIHIGGGSPDRIAANIVTGVGFLGGGVIFKEGFSVTGLTTATTIWVAAAIGMGIGTGNYICSVAGLTMAVIVLSTFEYIQNIVEWVQESRIYIIHFYIEKSSLSTLEAHIRDFNLTFHRGKSKRNEDTVEIVYEIKGKEKALNALSDWLMSNPQIKSFEH